ncbi:glycosyltransferase [Wenxinia marina]|uniref:Putative glycosyltransferase n=1 Tax=Wenxinia marina DSM 24838 TaxID=1123501 RepID=A0A0D0QAD6_9RHOB|nr:glycosyltransferase [Wenxinia marina]KIQ69282.1 putative glycosyltransferase [Wenxinia marina DSM 24838]GGL71801.1 hypothetical protein GCM10011392_28000 [Wenxinia marina]
MPETEAKDKETVSAIVPTFNRSALLAECLDSLLSQTRPPDQILVVDDGSTDNTAEIVSRYAPAVSYVRKENGGKSSALNLALSMVTGDYVWICDDDDIAAAGGLEAMMRGFAENPSVAYVFGDYRSFQVDDTGEKIFSDPDYRRRHEEPNLKINFLEGMFILQFACLVRREVYVALGNFEEQLIRSQDYDMMLRLSQAYAGAYVPEIIFYYREHEAERGSESTVFDASESVDKWLAYDRIIFERLLADLPLDDFTPTFAIGQPNGQRAALIQRAVIFGKRAFWEVAAEDLGAAERLGDDKLTMEESQLLYSVIHQPEIWRTLELDDAAINKLSEIYGRSDLGREIVSDFLRPTVWIIRDSITSGNLAAVRQFWSILFKIAGVGTPGVILRRPNAA